MMLISFEPTAKDAWDIRIEGEKVGHVSKKRGTFVAAITRSIHPDGLDAICGPNGLVADLNRVPA